MNLLQRIRDVFVPQREQDAPAGEPEEPEAIFTAEDMQAYANAFHAEQMNRLHGQQPGRKFRPLLMDFAENQCYAQREVNGVKTRFAVRCPWSNQG